MEEEDGPPCLREKRAASQESYHLEAYDCNEPEEIRVYPIPPQCPEIKGLVYQLTLMGTSRQNYTIIQEVTTFSYME